MLTFKVEKLPSITDNYGNRLKAAIVKFTGRIDASTLPKFQNVLDNLIQEEIKAIILELSNIDYISSTGLGALVNYHSLLKEKKGGLVINRASESVLHLLDVLGLKNLIPINDNIEEIIKNFPSDASQEKKELTAQQRLAVIKSGTISEYTTTFQKSKKETSNILIVSLEGIFADVLEEILKKNRNNKIYRATTKEKVFPLLQSKSIDVAIIDYLVDKNYELCEKIKLDPELSLVSVIVVYEEGINPRNVKGVCVQPNEFISEPFEIEKVLTLINSEIERSNTEKDILKQEFIIRATCEEENIEKVNDIIKEAIRTTAFGKNVEDMISVTSAIREAIDNAKRHGNKDDVNKYIEVIYILDKEKLTISVKDEGEGFEWKKYIAEIKDKDPSELVRLRGLENVGGLGISLMLRCMDMLSYNNKGNEITLTKYLPSNP